MESYWNKTVDQITKTKQAQNSNRKSPAIQLIWY